MMEKIIENTLDNGLENISSQLHIFSIGIGIVLIILGIILFFTNRGVKGKRSLLNCGLICVVIGIIAIISGLVQM